MKHYGDITKLNGHELPIVDVVTGGSPCQDLSVAGKRAGLAGERSGLFMEQIRIIKELRNECIRQLSMRGADEPIRPRYMVWENVVGAFSSNNGEDFRAVLEETAKIKDENAYVPRPNGKWANAGVILGNGYSLAWRVHDAQYWGVPQRRRRICLLADFDGNTAQKILFELRRETVDTETEQTFLDFRGKSRSEVPIECESLRRNTETCGEQGKGTATAAQGNPDASISFQERAGCPGGGKGILIQNEKTASLSTLTNQFVCNSSGEEVAGTLDANYYKGCGTRRGHEREVVATYQDTTGSLCASGYDKLGTQEAMNDMYVVSSSWDGTQVSPTLTAHNANGGQRMPDKDNFNAVISYGSDLYNGKLTGDQATTLTTNANATGANPTVITCEKEEPILLESNQNHATIQTDGISTALPASMGMGGGYVPMVTYGVDCYNQTQSEETAQTIRADKMDSDHIPCVYGLDRASFNQGKNALYDFAVEVEKAQPLVARGPGGVLQQ